MSLPGQSLAGPSPIAVLAALRLRHNNVILSTFIHNLMMITYLKFLEVQTSYFSKLM